MQSQHSSPRTGMNWLYFATSFLVCLAVLFAAKYALDMLAGHATSRNTHHLKASFPNQTLSLTPESLLSSWQINWHSSE